MYVVAVVFEVQPAAWDAFLPLMLANARTSLAAEPGCHRFDVAANPDKPQVFLYELYTDRAAFDVHLASEHFQVFKGAVQGMVAGKTVHTYEQLLTATSSTSREEEPVEVTQ